MNPSIEIKSLSFEETWNIFKIEVSPTSEEYKLVRYGIKLKFDIYDYLKGRVLIKAKTGIAFIRNAPYRVDLFDSELEERERIAKLWLLENMTEEEIGKPRTGTVQNEVNR